MLRGRYSPFNLASLNARLNHSLLSDIATNPENNSDHDGRYLLDAGTPADNTLLRFDGTDGRTTQTTGIIVDNSDNISGIGTINSGAITATDTSLFDSDISIASGSITSASGTIDFGNEDLTTSGSIISTGGAQTGKFLTGAAGNTVFAFSGDNFDIRAGSGGSSSQNVMRVTSVGDFDFKAGNLITTGKINFRDTDISIGSTLTDGILDMTADFAIDMFFDNADRGEGVDGQHFNINRRAAGDDYISLYVDKDRKGLIGFSGDDDLLQLAANLLTVNGAITSTGLGTFATLSVASDKFTVASNGAWAVDDGGATTVKWSLNPSNLNLIGERYFNSSSGVNTIFIRSRGTEGTPLSLNDNDTIFAYRFQTWNSAAGGAFTMTQTAFTMEADGNHGDGSTPTKYVMNTILNGSVGQRPVFAVRHDGNIDVLLDGSGIRFGAGTDAQIYYDTTDLIIDPALVGTGGVNIQGDTFWVGSGTGLPYGHMYVDGTQVIRVALTVNTPAEVKGDGTGGTATAEDGWLSGELNLITFPTGGTEHYITITKAGVYHITWNLSFKMVTGAANTQVHAGLAVDGTAIRNKCEGHRTISNNTDTGSMSGTCTVDLPNGNEELSLWMENTTNSNDADVVHGSLTAVMVGGT